MRSVNANGVTRERIVASCPLTWDRARGTTTEMSHRRSAFIALAIAMTPAHLSACATGHVYIDPPPSREAPHEMRAAYYDSHRPEPVTREDLETRTRFGSMTPVVNQIGTTLHNE